MVFIFIYCFIYVWFFFTLFLEILDIEQGVTLEISIIFFLIYMTLEVLDTINSVVIKNGKTTDLAANYPAKLILLSLSGIIFLLFYASDLFKGLHNERIILGRDLLITFSCFTLLSYCVNNIFYFSSRNKNMLAMKLLFLSSLLILAMTKSFFMWFDSDIASSLIEILSGMIGGALTLLGVLWTIKRGEQIRKDDIKLRNKPYLLLAQNFENVAPFMKIVKITDFKMADGFLSSFVDAILHESNIVVEQSNVKDIFAFERCIIKNSENAICIVRGVEINGVFREVTPPFLLDANESFCLFGKDVWFSVPQKDFTASIIVADTSGNGYSISLDLTLSEEKIQRKEQTRLIVSVGTIFKINRINLPADYDIKSLS